MSENAEALDVIREEAGEDVYDRICYRLIGSVVRFPYRRDPLIKERIRGLLRSGYGPGEIAEYIGCSSRYVRKVKAEQSD